MTTAMSQVPSTLNRVENIGHVEHIRRVENTRKDYHIETEVVWTTSVSSADVRVSSIKNTRGYRNWRYEPAGSGRTLRIDAANMLHQGCP
jgi:hypothetical protein